MKKLAVDDDNTISHPEAKETADCRRDHHDDKSEINIVESDLARGVPEGFELGDFLTLKPNKPGKHSARHKCGDSQKDCGERYGKSAEYPYPVVNLFSREVVLAVIGNEAAIGTENTVDLSHDRAVVAPGRDLCHHVVKRPIESESFGKCALIHPKDSKAATVRNGFAWARLVNILG